jgi:hypothetical protein
VKAGLRQKLHARKRQIRQRLDKTKPLPGTQPILYGIPPRFDFCDRTRGLGFGGIPLFHQLAQQIGLVHAIDQRLHLLKIHLPYHESDHVLNFAFNALCLGDCLQDIELRRNDAGFLDALGAVRIPDPTTAGDFCRRFAVDDINTLQDIYDDVRIGLWQQQPHGFLQQAQLDVDGTLTETSGECKQGMDIAYDGT